MALGGRREAAGYHCALVWKKMPQKDVEEVVDLMKFRIFIEEC